MKYLDLGSILCKKGAHRTAMGALFMQLINRLTGIDQVCTAEQACGAGIILLHRNPAL